MHSISLWQYCWCFRNPANQLDVVDIPVSIRFFAKIYIYIYHRSRSPDFWTINSIFKKIRQPKISRETSPYQASGGFFGRSEMIQFFHRKGGENFCRGADFNRWTVGSLFWNVMTSSTKTKASIFFAWIFVSCSCLCWRPKKISIKVNLKCQFPAPSNWVALFSRSRVRQNVAYI